jgi:4-hydroxybenzoate polyprenyltransferase
MDEIKSPAGLIKLRGFFLLLRPRHWLKNMFVTAPLLFSGELVRPASIILSVLAFLCFCTAASAVYVFNDMYDMDKDRVHPAKKHRPLTAGIIGRSEASALLILLVPASVINAFIMSRIFGLIILVYFINNLLYTLILKKLVIIDAMSVAAGFLLRVAGGAAVIDVEMSPWLILCTFLLALMLGLGKRKNELTALGESAANHRLILNCYTREMTDSMLSAVSAASILSYSLYTFFSNDKWYYIFTTLFVIYGILRYLYLLNSKNPAVGPEEILFSDAPTVVNLFLWVLASILIIY